MGFELGSISPISLTVASNSDSVQSISLFVTLICGCTIVGHLLEENRWMNESITTLVIGLCTEAVILVTSGGKSRILEFNGELFFIYLLPPIIFNAGFQVKKKHFFDNFIPIMLYGAFGTLISFSIISLGAIYGLDTGFLNVKDRLAIGAIFSATDSVCTLQVLNQDQNPILYSLVFGEGVVNDATSVVLFNAIQKFDLSHINSDTVLQLGGNFLTLFVTSTMLGVIFGLLSAYIMRKLYLGRHSSDREVALMIMMAYLSYVMAELFDLSGILTVFVCGIVMSHYTWHSMTNNSRVTTKHSFATLSFISEICIFLYVGMDALDVEKWQFVSNSPGKSVVFSAMLLGLIMIGRASFVFPLSFIVNLTKKSKSEKIGFKQQITIWWAGLMRGAVSMALAYNQFTMPGHTQQQGNAIMITSTISVVLFSTMVFGFLTKPLVRHLMPPSLPIDMLATEPSSPTDCKVPLLSSTSQDSKIETGDRKFHRYSGLRRFISDPTLTVHSYWRKFDDTYMRSVFGGSGFIAHVPASAIEDIVH